MGKQVFAIFFTAATIFLLNASAVVGQTSFVTPDSSKEQKEEGFIEIMAGKSIVKSFDFVIEKVATGNPEIFAVAKSNEQEVLINAIKPGASNLLVWGSDDAFKEYLVKVISPDIVLRLEELKAYLVDIDGVDARIVGDRIALEGSVLRLSDQEKLNKLLADMPGVVNLTTKSRFMKKLIAETIQEAIGRESVSCRVARDSFIIEGVVATKEESMRAELIAKAYDPAVTNALLTPDGQFKPYRTPQLIEVDLTVMEIEKSALKEFGIYWNPSLSSQLDLTASAFSKYTWPPGVSSGETDKAYALAGILSSFFPKMNRIRNEGKGRSLMQQTLVAKEQSQAEFFAGTEQPIPIAQDGGTMSVEYKKVGMTLNFTPTVDEAGKIDALLEIESSSVSGEGLAGAPIISANTMSTAVNIASGMSIVLGGLAGQSDLKALLSENPDGEPTLFQLNSGDKKQMADTEVVIFITPRIVKDVKDAGKKVMKKTRDLFIQEELGNLRNVYNDLYGG